MRAIRETGRVIENLTRLTGGSTGCQHRKIHSSQLRLKATLLNGLERAHEIQEQLRCEVMLLKEKGYCSPQLTTVLVGNEYASHLYVKKKMIAANAVGISTDVIYLESSTTEKKLIDLINDLNVDKSIHAILVQLPLPEHICKLTICNLIAPSKDVDGFNFMNLGQFVLGVDTLWPCTALAVADLILSTGIETRGKHAVVCGRSKNVGFPISMILHTPHIDATTTICHRFTPYQQLCNLTRSADILVSATGVPRLITASMVKPGACVIDVGITRVMDKGSNTMKLSGDVDYNEVSKIAEFITPVPGGVGPMTVAMLLKNTVKAAKRQMGVV